jgi:hypothetical protein
VLFARNPSLFSRLGGSKMATLGAHFAPGFISAAQFRGPTEAEAARKESKSWPRQTATKGKNQGDKNRLVRCHHPRQIEDR